MRALLDDLVDFNRTQLGLGIKVLPADIDLAEVLADELEQLRGAHPSRRIEFAVTGDGFGHWDGRRLKQVLRNLVSNATEYASPDTPVRVALVGEEAGVRVEVANEGPIIDPSVHSELFNPLKRGLAQTSSHEDQDRLGLGLFIVRENCGCPWWKGGSALQRGRNHLHREPTAAKAGRIALRTRPVTPKTDAVKSRLNS